MSLLSMCPNLRGSPNGKCHLVHRLHSKVYCHCICPAFAGGVKARDMCINIPSINDYLMTVILLTSSNNCNRAITPKIVTTVSKQVPSKEKHSNLVITA